MSPEKLDAICQAVDAVMAFSEQKRKDLARAGNYLQSQIDARDGYAGSGERLSHADVIRIGEIEHEAEGIAEQLKNWPAQRAAALQNLEVLVGLGVRRTVNPAVQELVQALAKVRRAQPDGTLAGFSLPYVALACGLSEGTVSKLKSGTYPTSSFPATRKVGRRAARR